MPYVKFTGSYADFTTGRDMNSALHYENGSTLTSIGVVEAVRAGDTEIYVAEYDTLKATIAAYNAANAPAPPAPPPDVTAAKLAVMTTISAATIVGLGGLTGVFIDALNSENWDAAQGMLDAAQGLGLLSVAERAAIAAIFVTYNIPVT